VKLFEGELKFYYAALLLGVIGALCIIMFLASHSMETMMIMGFGMFLIVLGILSALYAIYQDRKKGSLKEALGLT